MVLSRVLWFVRGERPGVILLAAQWHNLHRFAINFVYQNQKGGGKAPASMVAGSHDAA
jgi:hypothetical protein